MANKIKKKYHKSLETFLLECYKSKYVVLQFALKVARTSQLARWQYLDIHQQLFLYM